MNLKKRDLAFVGLVVVVLLVFWLISGEEKTTRVPFDEIHGPLYPVVAEQGKKAAEKFCKECHTPEHNALPDNHPPPFRCLFCHKLIER